VIDFAGQVAIVTGAGRGLGRLYAQELARRGARVVVNDLGGSTMAVGADPGVADSVVEEIRAAGGAAVANAASVETPEGAAAIVQCALDAYGRIDAVVSNAGIYRQVPFAELSVDEWRRMLAVHLDGGFYLAQGAFRVMQAQGYGRFVFIASSVGAFGSVNAAHYGAAKGGVIALANSVALEGEPHGIRANSVLPTGTTRILEESVQGVGDAPGFRAYLDAIDPEKVVPIVAYLASRDCAVTHLHISASAGSFARVFTALGRGWVADPAGPPVTAEHVAAHLAVIVATDGFLIPGHVGDEASAIMARLAAAPRGQ
jgi:NAD(P)-dependent dehydrogenase (short-subunit alcohol dehydrogenase family)